MPAVLKYLEIENFKSFRGKQRIGPLGPFTTVIIPDDSDIVVKSDFVDSIIFVMGDSLVHVDQLSDLIHGASINRPASESASVAATFVLEDGTEKEFQRSVICQSTFHSIDGQSVALSHYLGELEKLGINVKAKNFLVFQGALESIAKQNPKERTALFEEISKSGVLKEEYEKCLDELNRADEEFKHLNETKKKEEERNEATFKIDQVLQKVEEERGKEIAMNEAFEAAKKRAYAAKLAFEKVKKERYDKFVTCFEPVANAINAIYKALAVDQSAQAVLGCENPEEPYLDGIDYNCRTLGNGIQPMSDLPDMEKMVAALALSFAIHSYQSAPFFLLDHIDGELDNTTIDKVASYIISTSLQTIIIPLNDWFCNYGDSVIGICPEPADYLVSSLYRLINQDELQD